MDISNELRRLLDKYGVEHSDPTEWLTYWHDTNRHMWSASEMSNGLLSVSTAGAGSLTPEQAIIATLGAGTCRVIVSDNLVESEGMGDAWADCSECGHLLFVLTNPNSEPPNYCPNCGRKVVDK